MVCCLLPFGLGSWVPLVAGLRARRPAWTVIGAVLCLVALVGLVVSTVIPDDQDRSVPGMLIIISWVAAAATTLAINSSYRRRREVIEELEASELRGEAAALRGVQRRREREREYARREQERERARELAREDPVGALGRGVGRPDLPDADHGHLVDINHAPAAILETLPGVDADLARRIVVTRENVGQFSSVADLAFVLDLDPDTTAQLERLAIAIDA